MRHRLLLTNSHINKLAMAIKMLRWKPLRAMTCAVPDCENKAQRKRGDHGQRVVGKIVFVAFHQLAALAQKPSGRGKFRRVFSHGSPFFGVAHKGAVNLVALQISAVVHFARIAIVLGTSDLGKQPDTVAWKRLRATFHQHALCPVSVNRTYHAPTAWVVLVYA